MSYHQDYTGTVHYLNSFLYIYIYKLPYTYTLLQVFSYSWCTVYSEPNGIVETTLRGTGLNETGIPQAGNSTH